MGSRPDVVTLSGATAVLNDVVAEGIRQLWATGQPRYRALARAARKVFKGGLTVRQVRYMADAIAEPAHESVGRGDARLLDAVEVAFLSLIVQAKLLEISGARLWAAMGSMAAEIRHGLRHPAAGLGLEVDWRGRARVLPSDEADADAWVFDLAEARADIDARMANRRREQDWEWFGWRRVPVTKLRKELRAR